MTALFGFNNSNRRNRMTKDETLRMALDATGKTE